MSVKLIGLTGLAGCGKSTARDVLIANGWSHVSMAGPLKKMAREFFECAGLDAEGCINGHLKETPLDEIGGASPRFVMQTLGTEWGREFISPDIWVSLAMAQCKSIMSKGINVVIDDIRFDNEAYMVKSLGGTIVNITGRGGIAGIHISENGVKSDFELKNEGTKRELENDVHYVLIEDQE